MLVSPGIRPGSRKTSLEAAMTPSCRVAHLSERVLQGPGGHAVVGLVAVLGPGAA